VKLDFLVIGVQKGGTTSLWQYLRDHSRLFMPRTKEAPFFDGRDADDPSKLAAFMDECFAEAPDGALCGKATPHYMRGSSHADVEDMAQRIATAFPDVRLIALLRDPLERAVSQYRMEIRRGREERSFEAAIADLLEPGQLIRSRKPAGPTDSYVAQGEYGRILGAYRERFPAGQLHVEMTEDLGSDPGGVLDRVLGFLGLPAGYRPEGLGVRHFRGGRRKRLDPEGQKLLLDFLRREALPHMEGDRDAHLKTFALFYERWNVAPEDAGEDEQEPVSVETRSRLQDHFRADAERLTELGIPAPWLSRWEAESHVR
jgi:hypothetical protein